MPRYATVEFKGEEGAIQTVPEHWLELTDVGESNGYCWWPEFSQIRKAKSGCEVDRRNWKKFPVKIMCLAESFEKAELMTERALLESDVEDKVEKAGARRRIVKPVRYQYSCSEASDYDCSNIESAPPKQARLYTSASERPLLPPAPLYAALDRPSASRREDSDCTSMIPDCTSTPLSVSQPLIEECNLNSTSRSVNEEHYTQPRRLINEDDNAFKSKVLVELNLIKSTLAQQTKMIRLLATPDDLAEFNLEQLGTVEELEDFSAKLSDLEFKKRVVRRLSVIGGKDAGSCVRNIMSTLGTNSLWANYSMRGLSRLNKHSFEKLALCQVIIRSCQKTNESWNLYDIKTAICNKLKYAKPKKNATNKETEDYADTNIA